MTGWSAPIHHQNCGWFRPITNYSPPEIGIGIGSFNFFRALCGFNATKPSSPSPCMLAEYFESPHMWNGLRLSIMPHSAGKAWEQQNHCFG